MPAIDSQAPPWYSPGMLNGPVIRAQKNVSAPGGVDVTVFDLTNGRAFQGRIAYDAEAQEEAVHESLTITTERAQALLDDLWDAGIRPTKPEPAKLIGAMEKHIGQLFELAATLASK